MLIYELWWIWINEIMYVNKLIMMNENIWIMINVIICTVKKREEEKREKFEEEIWRQYFK